MFGKRAIGRAWVHVLSFKKRIFGFELSVNCDDNNKKMHTNIELEQLHKFL